MEKRFFKSLIFVFILSHFSNKMALAQLNSRDREVMVAVRMIGHQILLNSGDSFSRVLPVEKEEERFKLQFESNFEFEPDRLVQLIDSIVQKAKITDNYLVEIEDCENKSVVYSYKINRISKSDIVPCKQRAQPKGCYVLLFSLLTPDNLVTEIPLIVPEKPVEKATNDVQNLASISFLVIIVLGLALYVFLKKKKPEIKHSTENLIAIGNYFFDRKNMCLLLNNQAIELSGKESDLLYLLHTSVNETIERDTILNAVWGDDGDYIGRTLDVFISKLRKKLEADDRLKIVNIRGIGYKLIVNE